MNNATMNLSVQISVQVSAFNYLGLCPLFRSTADLLHHVTAPQLPSPCDSLLIPFIVPTWISLLLMTCLRGSPLFGSQVLIYLPSFLSATSLVGRMQKPSARLLEEGHSCLFPLMPVSLCGSYSHAFHSDCERSNP